MRIKNFLITYFYLIAFLTFWITTLVYSPRPRLKNLFINDLRREQLFVERIISKDKLKLRDNVKREINTGKSYLVVINEETSFTATQLAFFSKTNLNLRNYSKYFPELIINADDIITVKKNTFGMKVTKFGEQYQACFLNNKSPSLFYKVGVNKEKYKYNDYDYWISIVNREFSKIFKGIKKENFNCLLITTNNKELFEGNNMKLSKIIEDIFMYKY